MWWSAMNPTGFPTRQKDGLCVQQNATFKSCLACIVYLSRSRDEEALDTEYCTCEKRITRRISGQLAALRLGYISAP